MRGLPRRRVYARGHEPQCDSVMPSSKTVSNWPYGGKRERAQFTSLAVKTSTGGLLVNCVSTISTVRTSPPVRYSVAEVYLGVVTPVGVITMVTVCEVKL